MPPSTTITLRPATAADQDGIVRVVRETGINLLDIKWPHFVVAVDDDSGEIVATGQIKQHNDRSYELASIGTLAAYRHQGLAHRIITRLLDQHPGLLYLMCLDNMEPLYQEFGFRTIDTDEMTPYFRRLVKLARAVGHFSSNGSRLLIMRRDPRPDSAP